MSNIYLIVSNDEVTIKEKINSILSSNNIDAEIIKVDLEENGIDKLLEPLNTYGFFDEVKVVMGYNANFLGTTKKSDEKNSDLSNLENYINNPSDNILILVNDKVDSKKKIVKLLKSKATVYDEDVTINSIIYRRLDGFKMDNSTTTYLIDYCDHNNEKILNELEKLKLYKMEEKVITKKDIDDTVMKFVSDNIFDLVSAICSCNKKRSMYLYEELTNNGEELIKIIAVLEEQFRIMYNGRLLIKNSSMSYDEAASILNVHPYRFKKSIEASRIYSIRSIFDKLYKLTDVELKVKTGYDGDIAFKMFIYNL